jgi:acylphosphatase
MKHYNIRISGRVQGVFFRKHTVEKALELGVKGFVRNEANGDVYCEAEGEELVLEQFVQWCHQGSPMSIVKDVKVEEGELHHFSVFEIQRLR